MLTHPIIFIVGPTASGKSDVAIELAHLIGGEIISCDSMQVYKNIQIASNKPSVKDLKSVQHHLINIVSVSDEFDVASYNQLALKAIQSVLKKGKYPIVVGGSGLYAKILLDGIFEGGEKDEALRKKLMLQAKEKGNAHLYGKLEKVDPQAAEKIHPNDVKRIIRALEVFYVEKEPISKKQKFCQGLWGKEEVKIFGLNLPREALYANINLRAEAMIGAGLIEEIKKIKNKKLSKTVRGLIGVKEILGFIDGQYDLEKAKELLKLNTRHLAKRQMTWFRKEKRIEWIETGPSQHSKDIAIKIKERISL